MEEDRHASKEDRMRRHLGLQKQVPVPFKPRAATHRQAVNSSEYSDAAVAETDALKRQIVDLQSQVSTLKLPPQPKNKTSYPESAEINELKRQVKEIKAQVASMNITPQKGEIDSPEVEMTTLKRQIAEVQSQIPTRGVQSPHMTKNTYQTTAEQRSIGGLASNRPRPWYCFRCGEDGHIAPSCEREPNTALVEEKRRQCKEKQLKWDQLNC